MLNLDNPTIITNEEIKNLDMSKLKAICSKSTKGWVATAYIETDEKIVVMAIGHGKNPKKLLKSVLSKAINRGTFDA